MYERVVELKEMENIEDVNKYLKGKREGKWILLNITIHRQRCYTILDVEGKKLVEPFDKIARIYIIGRVEK